jgi:hypothetical protein
MTTSDEARTRLHAALNEFDDLFYELRDAFDDNEYLVIDNTRMALHDAISGDPLGTMVRELRKLASSPAGLAVRPGRPRTQYVEGDQAPNPLNTVYEDDIGLTEGVRIFPDLNPTPAYSTHHRKIGKNRVF